jgi:hypothetical protein
MLVGNNESDDEGIQQFLTIDLSLSFKEDTEDDLIFNILIDPYSPTNDVMNILEEGCSLFTIKSKFNHMHFYLYNISKTNSMSLNISLGKKHNISPRLEGS